MTNAQLMEGLRTLVEDAEELLVPDRTALPRRVKAIGRNLSNAREVAMLRTRAAARNTDEWVHEHPWRAAGITAAVVSVFAWAMGRRAHNRTCAGE